MTSLLLRLETRLYLPGATRRQRRQRCGSCFMFRYNTLRLAHIGCNVHGMWVQSKYSHFAVLFAAIFASPRCGGCGNKKRTTIFGVQSFSLSKVWIWLVYCTSVAEVSILSGRPYFSQSDRTNERQTDKWTAQQPFVLLASFFALSSEWFFPSAAVEQKNMKILRNFVVLTHFCVMLPIAHSIYWITK